MEDSVSKEYKVCGGYALPENERLAGAAFLGEFVQPKGHLIQVIESGAGEVITISILSREECIAVHGEDFLEGERTDGLTTFRCMDCNVALWAEILLRTLDFDIEKARECLDLARRSDDPVSVLRRFDDEFYAQKKGIDNLTEA